MFEYLIVKGLARLIPCTHYYGRHRNVLSWLETSERLNKNIIRRFLFPVASKYKIDSKQCHIRWFLDKLLWYIHSPQNLWYGITCFLFGFQIYARIYKLIEPIVFIKCSAHVVWGYNKFSWLQLFLNIN